MKPAIETAVLRALHEIQPVYPSPTIPNMIDTLIAEETNILDRLSTNFQTYIKTHSPKSLLTLSNSSTIFAALKSLFTSPICPPLTLTILESRPLFEGVTLATQLFPFKPPHVTLQLAVDAAAAYFSAQSDLLILGADHVNPTTGNVKNKIGSLAAVRFAKRTVCVTSTDKLARQQMEEEEEENDVREVTRAWGEVEGVEEWKVRNIYFEWVEGRDVEGYVTEVGVLRKRELTEIYRERESWQEVWNLLGRDSTGEKR